MSKSAADGRRKKLERLGVKRRRLRKKTSRGGRIMHTLVRVQSRLELFERPGEQRAHLGLEDKHHRLRLRADFITRVAMCTRLQCEVISL